MALTGFLPSYKAKSNILEMSNQLGTDLIQCEILFTQEKTKSKLYQPEGYGNQPKEFQALPPNWDCGGGRDTERAGELCLAAPPREVVFHNNSQYFAC